MAVFGAVRSGVVRQGSNIVAGARCGPVRFGSAWREHGGVGQGSVTWSGVSVAWQSIVWWGPGGVWFGMEAVWARLGSVRPGAVRLGAARFGVGMEAARGLVCGPGMARWGLARFGGVRCGLVRQGSSIWPGVGQVPVRSGTVRPGKGDVPWRD
jgi:hypothetical protein